MNEKNIWKMKKGRKVKYQLHIGARNFLLESNIESLKCNLQANTEFARSGEWQAKVTFSSVMIFLIVFSSFTVLAPKAQTVQVSGNENVIFQDDFESYAVGTFPSQGGWQIVYNGAGNQYIVVTNSCYYSPTKSFQTKGRSGWSCVVKRDFSSNSSVIGYEGCIMTTGTDASGSISFSNQYVVTWGRYYAGVGFSGGYIVSGSHVFAPISPGSWTKVRVVLDKNTRLYDVWINDTLSAENLVEPNDPNEILSLQVGTGWPSTPNYFDDVKVFSVSSLDASISPANATTSIGGTTNYGITVRNYADISDNVTLSISGLNPSWYSLSNDRLMMVPGETSTVQLNVTVPENPENAGFYPFNVIINGLSAQKVVGANLTVLLSPTVDSLEPQDGITIGSTDLLISWRTSVQASSEVYIKRADESTFTHVIGENGTDHFVHAYNLSRNADYSWCAYSATQYANVSSAFRTLHVSNGVSFSQYVYTFNVERDYAQYESVSVINNDTQSHDLLLQALNPYQDLIVGFVGAGSVDENVTLAPGETMSVDFNIFAQDAMQSTYVFEFKLTNLGPEQVVDYAEVNVNVRQPNINLEVVQTETDNATLAGTYVVTNHGDTVTDLRIAPDDQIKSQLQIQPVINHALLRSGESLQFEAVPMLTTNFTGLQGNIQVEASNVTENVPLNVTLPEGMSVFTVLRNNVTWTTSFHDWYCTNRPRIDEVFTLPSWIKKTVNGEPNVDNAALIIDFFLVWPLEDYRPHSVHLFMNGVEFGSLQNTIPASFFIFPLDNSATRQFDSYLLNYASDGLAQNVLTLQMDNLNGGHYVVSAEMRLVLHIRQVELSIVAPTEAEANRIADGILGTTLSNFVDLGVYPEGITVSDTHPQQGENLTISAKILNFGTLAAQNVPVSLYIDSTKINTQIIPDVSPFSTQIINFTWTATTGTRNVTIAIDENRTLGESDYTNNQASIEIFVGTPTITFSQIGLLPQTSWSASLDGATASSTGATIKFAASNGTHQFTIGSVSGYTSSPASGNVIVNGTDVTVSITFHPILPAPAENLIFEDDFHNDGFLNTALWRVNAPMLYSIAEHESSAFVEGVSVGYPNLPIGFSNQGMGWGVSGYNAMSGITSNIVFTPPYVVELYASISSMTGGNPISIFLTNNGTSSFIAIFVSNSIWIQTAYDNPVDICDNVNNGVTYTFLINVTTSSLEVIVMNGGQQIADYNKNLTALDDYGYYLTLGSFAGQIPGEPGRNPSAAESYYTSVEVTSGSTWNLTVRVNDDKFQQLQNVNVVVTNLFRDVNYTQNTDNTGATFLTNLVSGFYTVGVWVSQGNKNVTGQTSVLIGNPSSPQQTDIYATIVLSIPSLSDLSVRIPPLNEDKTIGLAPLNDTFHADAAGWVGNYLYTWYVNGTAQQEKSSDFQKIFDSPGTYEVEVTVTSSGTWYDQPEETRSATSEVIPICVSNSPYLASLSSTGDSFVSLSYNGASNQAILYIENGRVLMEADATDNALNVISVPEWLSILLGAESAWRGITFSSLVNGKDAAVDTGLIIEPGSTVDLNNASLPMGAPTGLQSLKGYRFKVILDPTAKWALASDAVTIVFGMLGFCTTIASIAPDISGSDMSWIIQQVVQLLAEQGARLAIDISTNTKDICSALGSRAGELMKSLCSALLEAIPEAMQRILLRYLGYSMASKICTALVSQVAHWAVKLASGLETLYLTAQFLVDAAAMLSTILPGPKSQEFNITDIKAMSSVTVKGHSPAPYVTVQKGAETYGYKGSWVSSTSAFVCSDYTADEYSFAIEDPETVQLLVQAPPGQSSTDYTINLYHNGLEANVSGKVTAGNPQSYSVTYANDSIIVTPNDTTPPITALAIGEPKYVDPVSNVTYVTQYTPFTLEASDAESGVSYTAYHIYNSTFDGGWKNYTTQFVLDTLKDGNYTIEFYSVDKAGNVEATNSANVTLHWLYGDVNHDGKVSLGDLTVAAIAYRSRPGDPNWNQYADTAPPWGIISLTDIVTVAVHYGQTFHP